MTEQLPDTGSPRDPGNIENPRMFSLIVRNDLMDGLTFGADFLRTLGLGTPDVTVVASDEDTTQLFVVLPMDPDIAVDFRETLGIFEDATQRALTQEQTRESLHRWLSWMGSTNGHERRLARTYPNHPGRMTQDSA